MYIKNISNIREAERELEKLGVHGYGIKVMAGKMIKKVFYLRDLEIKAANILKQECLAIGAELALPKDASLLKGKVVDAILIIDSNKIEILLGKLKKQPFSLKEVADQIEDITIKYDKSSWVIKNGSRKLTIKKPLVMGILNVTPDSFSDGGEFNEKDKAVEWAISLIKNGVDILDIGGESTGPGTKDVSVEEELKRVIPVVKAIRKKNKKIWISVDTYKSEVAREAIKAGADMINDVTALRGDKKMAGFIAKSGVPVIFMYCKDNTPRTTRQKKEYKDVVFHVMDFMIERIAFAMAKGVKREQILIDPGMGAFVSSNPKYSLEIVNRLDEFKSLGFPILIGPSRKSFIGDVLDLPVSERKEGTLGVVAVAILRGANIVRVHDVKECKRVCEMVHAINSV